MTPRAASPTFSEPPLAGYIHSRKFLPPPLRDRGREIQTDRERQIDRQIETGTDNRQTDRQKQEDRGSPPEILAD